MGLRFNIDIGIKSRGAGQAAGDIRKVKTEAGGAGKTINTINASLLKMATLVGAAFSVREISQFVASTVRAASDVQEMQALLEVTFGKAVDDVREWAAETSGAVGRSRFELLRFAGDFAAFMKPLGTAPAEIRPMSQALAQLTVDLASFRNLAEEDVLTKLMSGLAGETQAVRRLGVDLSAAAVEQELLAQGINKTNAEATQGEKVMARYAILMRQTSDAQGDAERTSDGLANMQRRLEGILQDVRVEIGQELLPIITEMAQDLAEFSQTQEFEDTLKDIGSAAGSAAEFVKSLVDAVRGLTNLGEPLANVFNTLSGRDIDPERLRKVALVIGGIERFLTFDQVGETALAGRIRDFADEVEASAQKVRDSKPDFDLSGVLSAADVKLAELTAEQLEKMAEGSKGAADGAQEHADRQEELEAQLEAVNGAAAEQRTRLDELRSAHFDRIEAIREEAQVQQELDELHERAVREATQFAEDDLRQRQEMLRQLGERLEIERNAERERERAAREAKRAAEQQIRDWRELGQVIAGVADAFDSSVGDMIAGVTDLIATVQLLRQNWEEMSRAQRFAAGAQVGAQVSNILIKNTSLKGSQTGTSQFGGRRESDFADVGGQIGGAIGTIFGPVGTVIGAVLGTVIGGAIKKGADEGLAQIRLIGDEISTRITKDEAGLGQVLGGFGEDFAQVVNNIVDALGGTLDFLPDIDLKIRGDDFVVFVNGLRLVFDNMEDAMNELVRQTFRTARLGGQIDEAFQQLLRAGEFGSVEELSGFIGAVETAINAEKMFIQGMSEIEIALSRSQVQIAQWTEQFMDMGLSADQAIRLAGANTVAFFSQMRQSITGEQLSVAERQQIQRAQAELFNAQMELEIARLEAERQALLAEAGLTEAEIKLITEALDAKAQGLEAEASIAEREIQVRNNVLDGRAKFLRAEGQLYDAELKLGAGFIDGMVEVIRLGGDTLGEILGSLPEEIRKQVEAITKIIAALKNIGTIDIGRLRLPGVPQVPSAPSAGPRPGDVEDTSRAAREAVDELIQSLHDMTSEMVANINELKSSIADLQRFREGLLIGNLSPLPLQGQLEEAERQLRDAAARARAGDVGAFGEVQQLSQQFLQLLAGVSGTAGPGFQAGFRFVDELIGDLIEEGNALVESETELLRAMRSNTADQLAAQREQLGLTREEIQEIRTGWERQVEVQRNIIAEQERLREEMRSDNAALRRAIVELAEAS